MKIYSSIKLTKKVIKCKYINSVIKLQKNM